MKNLIAILSLCSLVAGCASMSKEECQTADWEGLGYVDGKRGKRITKFEERKEVCRAAGYPADYEHYAWGRERGLLAYCTPDKGYKEGKYLRRYEDVCPGELESDFLKAYFRGLEYSRSQNRLELQEAEREYGRLEVEIQYEKDEAKRKKLKKKLSRLNSRILHKQTEINRAATYAEEYR